MTLYGDDWLMRQLMHTKKREWVAQANNQKHKKQKQKKQTQKQKKQKHKNAESLF